MLPGVGIAEVMGKCATRFLAFAPGTCDLLSRDQRNDARRGIRSPRKGAGLEDGLAYLGQMPAMKSLHLICCSYTVWPTETSAEGQSTAPIGGAQAKAFHAAAGARKAAGAAAVATAAAPPESTARVSGGSERLLVAAPPVRRSATSSVRH